MRIIVDAFGGDNAPLAVLQGASAAVREYNVNILLCGNKQKILDTAREHGIPMDNMDIAHAPEVFDIHEEPTKILKARADTSLAEGFRRLVMDDGDAFVSAGSTGAMLVGATFIVKRIKGVKRPALGAVLPGQAGPVMLIDTGANVECRPEMLVQFAAMGGIYMNKVLKIGSPRVGLLNVGAEDTKGDQLRLDTHRLLSESNSKLNFVGNVEARDALEGVCDVLAADGFSGNVLLKSIEGTVGMIMKNIKAVLTKNALTKAGAILVKPGMKELKAKMDYAEYGGAPLLGVCKPVIKAHGSSDAKAIKNAVRQAADFTNTGVIKQIGESIDQKK